MKRMLMMAAAAGMLAVYPARAGSAVQPASVAVTNVRGEAAESILPGTLYRGSTLLFTNCVVATTNAATPQTLTNVTVTISVGNLSTNNDYTATVQDAALGKWSYAITVPDLASWFLQVKVTDENTNVYIYPSKTFVSEQSMF